VGPFGQGPLDVWQFAIVGFLVAAKGERLDSAGVLYRCSRLRIGESIFGRIAPESPAPEGWIKPADRDSRPYRMSLRPRKCP